MGETYARRDLACKGCEHFAPMRGVSTIGTCRRLDGPSGKLFAESIFPSEPHYPIGCPIDPEPPPAPRKRPGMDARRGGTKPHAVEEPKQQGMRRRENGRHW